MYVNFIPEAAHPYSGGNPEEVFAIGRCQKQFASRVLFHETNGVAVHRVGKAILCLCREGFDSDGAFFHELNIACFGPEVKGGEPAHAGRFTASLALLFC